MKSGETGSDLHIHDSKIYPTNSADYYQYFKEYGQKYDIGNQEGYMLSMEPDEVELEMKKKGLIIDSLFFFISTTGIFPLWHKVEVYHRI